MPRHNCFTFRLLFSIGLSSLMLAGCGGSEKGLVPVSGYITFDGGPWPKPGKITFLPIGDSGTELRPASADFATDGAFTVSSYDGSQGLYPGEYGVTVECWEEEPGMAKPEELKERTAKKDWRPSAQLKPVSLGPTGGKSYVPPLYQNPQTSPLKLKVALGESQNPKYDVKTK